MKKTTRTKTVDEPQEKEPSNISRRRRLAQADGGAEYAAKREELVGIAVRLFRERGYTATRLLDIANAAGVDRATVYYYVGSKEELFRESVQGILGANLAKAEAVCVDKALSVSERIQQIVALVIASYEESYPAAYVYIQEQMHQVAKEESTWADEMVKKTKRFETLVRNLIKEGMDLGEFRQDVPVKIAANGLFGMINWMHRWHVPNRNGGDKISAAFSSIFCQGMQAQGQ